MAALDEEEVGTDFISLFFRVDRQNLSVNDRQLFNSSGFYIFFRKNVFGNFFRSNLFFCGWVDLLFSKFSLNSFLAWKANYALQY